MCRFYYQLHAFGLGTFRFIGPFVPYLLHKKIVTEVSKRQLSLSLIMDNYDSV